MSSAISSQVLEDRITLRIVALSLVSLGAVWLMSALSYRDSTLIADTARDVVAATRLLMDAQLPSAGPALYGTWVLSPLWFWVFAGLVRALPSLTLVYVALGALAMSKLLLAWRIGYRIAGPLFAAVFAVFLFWPGWSFIEPVIVTHTNLVQASGLLFVLAALRARALPSPFRSVLMFAALALALATHPTNILYAPLVTLPFFFTGANRRASFSAGGLGIAIVALSLLPGFFHEAASTGASQSFLQRLPEPGALQRWPLVIKALLFDAQGSPLQQVALHWQRLARALQGGYTVIALLSCVGWLLIERRHRGAFVVALMALVAWTGLLAASRPTTPTWMVLSAQPLAYGLSAYGITMLLERASPRWRFAGFVVFLSLGVLAASAYSAARFQRARAGLEWHATDRVSDVSLAPITGSINSPHFPPRAQDAVGKLGCVSGYRLGLLGDLAVLAQTSQAASSRLHACPRASWPMLGSGPGLRAIAGVPAATAAQLGLAGVAWVNFQLTPVRRVVWPPVPRALRFNGAYPPYGPTEMAPDPLRVNETLAADEVLVVTGLMSGFASPTAALTTRGRVIKPDADTGSSVYFRCPGRTRCELAGTVVAGQRDALQVFVVTAKSEPAR